MGILPPVWLVEDEGRWWPAWCPEAGAFRWCFRFLCLPTLCFVLWYVWLVVKRVSPFKEEGRGTGSWDVGSEEAVRLSTTQGADEPRDCSDKVLDGIIEYVLSTSDNGMVSPYCSTSMGFGSIHGSPTNVPTEEIILIRATNASGTGGEIHPLDRGLWKGLLL